MVPDSSPAPVDTYRAARLRAAFLDPAARGLIVVSGADRASYLQGLLTNDIVALSAGRGCYAAYLTAQGRMITDLYVYELGDVILLALGSDVKDAVLARLDQFIFSEDVQLGDVSDTFAGLTLVGPYSGGVVASVLGDVDRETLAELPDHGNRRATFGGESAIVLRVTDPGEPGYRILVAQSQASDLEAAITGRGVPRLEASAAEALRLERGVPRFHQDMDEDTIPLEAGIEAAAISLTKGCYVGQEVIVRVLHRGHGRVARRLVGLVLEGASVPPAGSAISTDGREVGKVTSSAISPALGRPIALGYVHRDFVGPGTSLTVNGSTATTSALPFERPALA
jgi:folate-binding protein YgfZ